MKAGIALALMLALAVPVVAGTVQLSAYQDEAVDLSEWRDILLGQGYEVRNTAATPLFLAEVAEPSETVFVIAGMERSYGIRERAMIDQFLHDGGTVILGDAGGHVPNSVAKEYGVLFFGVPLRDAQFEFNQSFIRMDIPDWELKPLLVNPTALLCQSDACNAGSMASSSNQSFLDLDRDGVVGAGDDIGPFTMMVRLSVGDGTIVFLPSPAFATNDLLQEPENEAFILRLIRETAPDANGIIFDESRHVAPAGEQSLVAFLTVLGGFSAVPVARFLVAALFTVAALMLLRRATPFQSWVHTYNLDAPRPDPDRGHAAERVADLLRLKIKLDNQLVDATAEEYMRLAPDADVRSLLENPEKVGKQTLRDIIHRHLPAGNARSSNDAGHATQAADTPSPPTEAPST